MTCPTYDTCSPRAAMGPINRRDQSLTAAMFSPKCHGRWHGWWMAGGLLDGGTRTGQSSILHGLPLPPFLSLSLFINTTCQPRPLRQPRIARPGKGGCSNIQCTYMCTCTCELRWCATSDRIPYHSQGIHPQSAKTRRGLELGVETTLVYGCQLPPLPPPGCYSCRRL